MLKESYACGAAVVARTLRNHNTKYPVWCMVSDGISDECVAFLQTQFDNIVRAPLISHEVIPMKSKKQNQIYGSWIHNSFTKWNILNPELFPVEKVILVDADMLFLENCDELFDLPAPAMTFSSPWARPYLLRGGAHNPFRVKTGRYNSRELTHGEPVAHDMIATGLEKAIVGLACMVLVRPDKKLFDLMLTILSAHYRYGHTGCVSGFDEQLIAETFLTTDQPIYHIHQQYNWIVGKTNWLLNGERPKTQQYYNGKPWNERRQHTKWPDIIQWWMIADQIVAAAPDSKKWFYLDIKPS